MTEGTRKKDIQAALDHLAASDFRTGAALDKAHAICQAHEGDAAFDWLHALVHRIEGDDGNAAYWYRRAQKERHPGSSAEELRIIGDSLVVEGG